MRRETRVSLSAESDGHGGLRSPYSFFYPCLLQPVFSSHIGDFAAVVLLDARWAPDGAAAQPPRPDPMAGAAGLYPTAKISGPGAGLPSWIRDRVVMIPRGSFGAAQAKLATFFKEKDTAPVSVTN